MEGSTEDRSPTRERMRRDQRMVCAMSGCAHFLPARLGERIVLAMPYAERDGLRLYFERDGSGDPELLFVPAGAAITRSSRRSSTTSSAPTL